MAPANLNYAAFFRNVNLGQLKSPSRAQLERAFTAAGAAAARSFLTNGTLVFGASSKARAGGILLMARELLRAECGLEQPAFLRSVHYLAELLRADPFAAFAQEDVFSAEHYVYAARALFPAGCSAGLGSPRHPISSLYGR